MATAPRRREISLNGVHYPISGDVGKSLASVWPEKQVIGDYTKDSELLSSSWIIGDQRGGLGVKDMSEAIDSRRCWWSTLNTDFKGHLILAPQAIDCDNPTTGDVNPTLIIEYNNTMYVFFGTAMYTWTEATSSWSSLVDTLTASPTDAIVYDGTLYIAEDTGYETWDGTTLTSYTEDARYFWEWDSKMFYIENDGDIFWSINGSTWTASATSTLPSGSFFKPFLYRNVVGDVIAYIPTKEGLYSLGFDENKYVKTELATPHHQHGGRGAETWRDACYFSVGLGVYQMIMSNPAVITPVGLDQDYGLPQAYRGNIVKIIPGHNALYAIVSSSIEDTQTQALFTGGIANFEPSVIIGTLGYSTVFKWSGFPNPDTGVQNGWSVVKASSSYDVAAECGAVATSTDLYRLWFGMDRKIYYINLDTDLHNPLEIESYNFESSGEHQTPWFDADVATIDKLAIKVTAYVTDTSATEYVQVYYQTDYAADSAGWTELTNTSFADGQIDADGEATFTLGSEAGVAFKSIRFKMEFARSGSDTTVSPDVRWLRLSYIKMQDTKYAYTFEVNCTRPYRGVSAATLQSNLATAVSTQTLMTFEYKDDAAINERVRVLELSGVEKAGHKTKGKYQVTVVAP